MGGFYKQPVSVLVVIYTAAPSTELRTGFEVLLLERTDHPGYWQSVTGSCEPGETLVETALREVYEETGLTARQYELADWHTQNVYEIYPQWRHRYPPGTVLNTEHVFGLRLPHPVAVRLAPREHLNCQWLAWQDAASMVFSPSNRAALLELPEHAGSNGHGKDAAPDNETCHARFPHPNPLPEGEEANERLREFHSNIP